MRLMKLSAALVTRNFKSNYYLFDIPKSRFGAFLSVLQIGYIDGRGTPHNLVSPIFAVRNPTSRLHKNSMWFVGQSHSEPSSLREFC
jgi:hypothetical protein